MGFDVSFHNPRWATVKAVKNDDGTSFAVVQFIDKRGETLPMYFDNIPLAYAVANAFQVATGAPIQPQTLDALLTADGAAA